MTEKYDNVYETPQLELMEISAEGILCASMDDTLEYYLGDDEFEKLF